MVIRNEFCGHDISRLGFGAMRLPMKDGKIDQAQVNDMVRTALKSGVNYFDTSLVYHGGESESALGTAFHGIARDSYYLADKMSFWTIPSADKLDEAFELQLKKLGTDHIDFYLMHSLDEGNWDIIKKYNGIEWAKKLKASGKIRHLGFSIHAGMKLLGEVLDANDWDFAQIQYNYLDRDDNPGWAGYDELERRGIPVITMESLKGGTLTNLSDKIVEPFTALGHTPAEMAFRWISAKDGVRVILSGMSNIAQMRDNIRIFTDMTDMTDADYSAIDEVVENIRASQKISCTGCRYCMPCPMGVEIPDLFRAWNTHSMRYGDNWINGGDVDTENAMKCVKCGKCMEHCPQKLRIPDMLEKMTAEING
ncbi:MAG: aldo/keto reductase [Eubacteriales bacterium]